jgi:hypothetical protein
MVFWRSKLNIKYKIRRIFVKIFTIFIEFISNRKRQLMKKNFLTLFNAQLVNPTLQKLLYTIKMSLNCGKIRDNPRQVC